MERHRGREIQSVIGDAVRVGWEGPNNGNEVGKGD